MIDPPVDRDRDHILGPEDAEMTLVEYGSYTCPRCQAVHEVVEGLRSRFGDRMRYVFRHLPVADDEDATRASVLSEYADQTTGRFWEVHEALMERGPSFSEGDFDEIARDHGLSPGDATHEPEYAAARARVAEDVEGAQRGGVRATPTFFINGRRYAGAWDESSLADAMLGSLGHRIQSAAFGFVHWGPSSGLLLGLATVLALALSNSPLGPAFAAWWETRVGFVWGEGGFVHSLLHWVNHGLLTIFFFVVGLEIKREFTVGHLATVRSGALPVIAALGGIVLPAVIYATVAPSELKHGWGIPIGTDTAFAVALIVLLGSRVPVELRVFLTAAVIIDDIVAILVIALFYSGAIHMGYLMAGGAATALLLGFNRAGVYSTLPYAVCGVVLWFVLHEAGLHATLAGVILAVLIPSLPPANFHALLAQAATVIHLEDRHTGEAMRTGPSEPSMRTLDAIYARIESPADKLLRSVEPWSSYLVLPIFALANAGVAWSPGVLEGQVRLILAIVLGLVVGKPMGIVLAAWLAVRAGLAAKPDAYSWRQLCGAGALGGIGFTMSLFIASVAFPDRADYAAAKIAIFLASLAAGAMGMLILWRRPQADEA
ncbi:Na+/H+ antiporter NhaA [Planctomyces sp. SH-PL62]|uniref:Na+/H+ antiporter NhaA n=1 Tax=Planctomyces sp. SH-PL62 TaxID=1636152 RepID=UPI00078EC5AD|nr:Na+/H+ antiporter NhaA [Planctomyces sp. SH-PL62]AMV39487.1 Na(+)/H(+) antiporter NhaA [Planctomyces sp. SH-PL62]